MTYVANIYDYDEHCYLALCEMDKLSSSDNDLSVVFDTIEECEEHMYNAIKNYFACSNCDKNYDLYEIDEYGNEKSVKTVIVHIE